MVELRYCETQDKLIDAEYISEITAVFTTANARLRLYDMLSWLDRSQLIYCDTDSVIFLYDENNLNHKYPSNQTPDKPKSISFGKNKQAALSEWENEFNDNEWIDEVVALGAKSYAYKTNKGKITVKQKGITLDRANQQRFTFENMKKIALDNSSIESLPRFQFSYVNKQVITNYVSRTVSSTVDSKRKCLEGSYDTVPFGFCE
jgi:hypothetical protein